MNVAELMIESASVMGLITGINWLSWPAKTITAPGGYASYPQRVAYDLTYGRGADRIENLPLTMLTGNVTDRSARDLAGRWTEGSGAASLKARFEAHKWESCSEAVIKEATFDVEQIASVSYLAVVFMIDATGKGR